MIYINRSRISLSRVQMIALGFIIIIIGGTLILMLPVSTRLGQSTSLINALFTATSATCVVGLVPYDTFVHWTPFGQIIILSMIQIGGLGFITFGVYGMMLFRKKIDLKGRELIHDSLNSMHVGGSTSLVKSVVKGTLLFETIGALLLSIRFIPQMGIAKGIYYSVFHSVSAFCNAGFDLMGYKQEFSSLCLYSNDIVVNLVITTLIIIGGIGFLVWEDIGRNKIHFKDYMLHTKLVLVSTALLLVLGTVFFLFSERSGILSGLSFKDKLLASYFSSVTPRTAGFNTVNTALLSDAGKLFTIILMFIGGSPGSTAGGIKTTTVAAIVLFMFSYIRKQKGCFALKRKLEEDIIKKASIVFFINLALIVISVLVITINQNIHLVDAVFESFSAIGTVGMTTGITRELTLISKLMIILLMFCGRVGSLSFALTFSEHKKVPDIQYPTESILIG